MTAWPGPDALPCARVHPDTMFPVEGDRIGLREAKKVCTACPVRLVCLEGALARREKFGVFGGLGIRERRRILENRRRTAHRKRLRENSSSETAAA